MNNQLPSDTLLQGGKYKITLFLGQGGFGISYEAEQVALGRTVAIKEFFMKDVCNRDESTSYVSVPSVGSKENVERFREKFIKEARMIASLNHPNIVKIHDIFEENGTAYYVMEHLPGGSLADLVKQNGRLSELQALKYTGQIASALSYCHDRKILHLDVKPTNVLLNSDGDAVLIDFGISKHFDVAGHQTSSTPVGISKGFAPIEQYNQSDISSFSPQTDVYSLGATLYYLLTGSIPPEATDVYENGLERPKGVSDTLWTAIETAMRPRRKDRFQTIAEFSGRLGLSNAGPGTVPREEATYILTEKNDAPDPAGKPLNDGSRLLMFMCFPISFLWATIPGLYNSFEKTSVIVLCISLLVILFASCIAMLKKNRLGVVLFLVITGVLTVYSFLTDSGEFSFVFLACYLFQTAVGLSNLLLRSRVTGYSSWSVMHWPKWFKKAE